MRKMDPLRRLVLDLVAEGALGAKAGMLLINRAGAEGIGLAKTSVEGASSHRILGDIAVVGMSGRFGGAKDLDAYWDLIESGGDCLTELPERRFPIVEGARLKGGFLLDEDRFDPLFFRISPTEAAMMDPQQRLFLEIAYHALEDAGYPERVVSGMSCGVFVGAGGGDYAQRFEKAGLETNPLGLMGNVASILAARISYFLNLKGPSLALDSACSSSLVAVHMACESLHSRTCDMALAGGVAVIGTARFISAMAEAGMLSPSNRCSAFDAAADGFVCGEGAGAVVLKRLADAERDGDFIHGIIRGTGINQDGRTNGITAPSAPSQTALEAEVYARAGIDPATISYVEAHGTGTPLGDPIEFEALTAAFRRSTAQTGFCALGTAKPNIGHSLTAAGIAGLLKLLMMLRHRRIPPLAGYRKANPRIDLELSPFIIPIEAQDWLPQGPRRAAISSFGFSGTNAHAVVEEAPARPAQQNYARPHREIPADPFLFLLSAKSLQALKARALSLVERLARTDLDLRDIAYTLATGREHFACRLAIVAGDQASLRSALEAVYSGKSAAGIFIGEAKPEGAGPAMAALAERVVLEPPDQSRLMIIADLYSRGINFDWRDLPGAKDGNRVPLPVYPFERASYGIDPAPSPKKAPAACAAIAVADGVFDGVEQALRGIGAPGLAGQARAFQSVEAWGRKAMASAYAKMGLYRKQVYTPAGLRKSLRIVPSKYRLHEALVCILVNEGVLAREDDLLRPRGTVMQDADLADAHDRLAGAGPELKPFLTLLASSISALPDLLTGRMTATEILFPEGRMDLVEPVYKGNRLADHFNAMLAEAAATLGRGLRRPVRVLEIGAGTGGATTGLIQNLDLAEYHYTDISAAFTHFGRQHFAANCPTMRFSILDIEQEPLRQGFALGSYDLVVASNVLHAARNIDTALGNARSLLAPGGFLLLNEVTALQDFATLTFGLTDGWWAFEDAPRRIANAPLLDIVKWREALTASGFSKMAAFGLPGEPPDSLGQSVILAHSPDTGFAPPLERVQSAAPDPAASSLLGIVMHEVAVALALPIGQVDRQGRFMDYGVDSIVGSKLVARLNKALGLDMRPIVLFDHPSIQDLANFIAREFPDKVSLLPLYPAVDSKNSTQKLLQGSQTGRPQDRDEPLSPSANDERESPPKKPSDQRIAVIGMAGRFADCPNISAFHAMLRDGRSGITEVPADRWSADAASLPEGASSEARFLRRGGFLKDAADFDPLFFRMSGKEAELTDPQHRVFLTEAWRALEDAGYAERELDGRKCGVFAGAYGGDYTHRMTDLGVAPEAFAFMGNAASILAARIAYVMNLKGPCLAVDTACSSSLTAIHLACQSLLDGECDMALAGGVFLTTTMGFNVAAAKAGMLSPLGACKTFDAGADGFVPGEGAGAVVLKPLAAALADGDHIEAIILASAINQDGKTNGITAPSPESQASLEASVYRKAGIDPVTISYVEAHGTGTPLGDPIEIEGLTRAFRQWTDKKGFCAIGSVKTNIGHAAHAAGIAGFLKVVLSLKDRSLFPSLNFNVENPELRLAETPFTVNTELRAWETGGAQRRAAVSSFGFSGTNVHILLAEPEASQKQNLPDQPCLITLSAKSSSALARRIVDLRSWLAANDAVLADLARTLNAGRCHFEHRWAAVAGSVADLQAALATGRIGSGLIDKTGGLAPDLIEAGQIYLRTGELAGEAIPARAARLSLPAYPFEMQRYWLDRPVDTKASGLRSLLPQPRAAYFTGEWKADPIEPGRVASPIWLIAEEGGLGPQLARIWRGSGSNVMELSPKELAALDRPSKAPAAIIVLPGIDASATWDPAALPTDLLLGPKPIVELVQSLFGNPVRLLILHRGQPVQECLHALRPSIRFDGSAIDLRLLRIEDGQPDPAALGQWIMRELTTPDDAPAEAAIRDGTRFTRRMVFVEPTQGDPTPLRTGGHFLITGGGGVLAGLFARRLAQATGGRITLIGRNQPGDATRDVIRLIGSAIYQQADVTDEQALAAAIECARAEFGPVHGVLHAAGVPGGDLLRTADWASVAACLAPKAQGVVALDHVLRDERLDFFVVFSSLAAELGDFGQGAYALANAFCGRFAAWRESQRLAGLRCGRTRAIGWPLWHAGRGVMSPEGEQLYLTSSGMPYLETEQGWQAFLDALALPYPEIAVVPGARAEAEAFFGRAQAPSTPAPVKKSTVSAAPKRAALAANTRLDTAIKHRITSLIAQSMKLDGAQLDSDKSLADFGFDSIALKEFASRLGATYGVAISPAVFFARGTIKGLAAYIAETHPGEAAAEHGIVQELENSSVGKAATKSKPDDCEAIAIIGMSGRFPGSPDLRAFWRNLEAGTDLVGPLPEGRMLASKDGKDQGDLAGGFLDQIDAFDASFFRISPREAYFLDPQHRLAIEAVWHCVEDAGLKMSALAGRSIGVFFGSQVNEYSGLIEDRDAARAQIALGNIATMLPNRISYLFDLRGPSEAIDTACSSSLVAVHRAIRALQGGECEMALAGGVSLVLSAENLLSTKELGVLSSKGRCHSFDARADGYVKGEGIGAVLLKPLTQAEADGDIIHAVILGSAENHGGHGHSLTAPNGTAQADLIAAAIRRAGVTSDTIGYVEAHGTGTELGDPVEVLALKDAFAATASGQVRSHSCGLGTVKTNIGHLEPASGIAGLIKTILSLKHRVLPASLHFQQVNPMIDFNGTPFFVADRTRFWAPLEDNEGHILPRRAGVSSFGLGGSNVHVVLQEWVSPFAERAPALPEILVFSARDKDALQAALRRLAEFIHNEPMAAPRDIAETLLSGREAMEIRAAILWRPGQTLDDLILAAADAMAHGGAHPGFWIGSAAKAWTGPQNGEGEHQFMEQLWAEGQLGRLAALWVGGANLPKGMKQGRRITLPGYPFARTRFWFDREGRANQPPAPKSDPEPTAAPRFKPPAPSLCENDLPAPTLSGRTPPSPGVVHAVVRRQLAEALYLDEAQLDDRAGFADLGLDSILAVELAKSLNDELGTSLQATRLYDYANVEELVAYLEKSLRSCGDGERTPASALAETAFLLERLAEIGIKDAAPATKLDSIALQPAEAKAILAAANARFNCFLNETDASRCGTVAGLATLIAGQAAAGAAIPESLVREPQSKTCTNIHAGAASPGRGVADIVRRHLAKALYLDEALIDDRAGFADLGLDSILAVELAKSLNDELGTSLQATRLYDYANAGELAAYLQTCLEAIPQSNDHDMDSSPAAAFLIVRLAETGARGLTPRSRLDSIALQPAEAHAILGDVNKRFGCALDERDIRRCADLAALAMLIETSAAKCADYGKQDAPAALARVPSPDLMLLEQKSSLIVAPAIQNATAPGVAIIGYACRLPGAVNADAFWRNLCNGAVAVTAHPEEVWRRDIHTAMLQASKSGITPWGGYLTGIDRFDAKFFNIPPGQAASMDPAQRLFLETAWHALEMAGQTRALLDSAECGTFIGGGPSDYSLLLDHGAGVTGGDALLGNTSSILAARIGYFLNLRGPCLAIDTACSSGLVAMHAAWRAICDGDMDMALVGGVNLLVTPRMHLLTGAGGMLAPDGRCKTFEDTADGFAPAEGIVALVLKRLDRAIADNDRIHGVIAGVGINQNGATAGITAPSALAQTRLMKRLYERRGISAEEIGFVEAHGTGTKIGDALEFDALRKIFAEAGAKPGACVIGCAKPLIGHAFAASGLAAVVKILLALHHRQIPSTVQLAKLNEHMLMRDSPFRFAGTLEPWPLPIGGRRMAATTAYGLSGTNAHTVIAEPPAETVAAAPDRSWHLIAVSGYDNAALTRQIKALAEMLKQKAPHLGDLAYSLAVRRTHFAKRAAFTVRDIDELRGHLAHWPAPVAAVESSGFAELAAAYTSGGAIDWSALYPHGRLIDLPAYPFAADRFWPDHSTQNMPGHRPVTQREPVQNSVVNDVIGQYGKTGDLARPGQAVLQPLRELAAQVLHIDPAAIPPDASFDALGVDSASATEIMHLALARFSVDVPVIALWDHPTLEKLSAFISLQPRVEARPATFARARLDAFGNHDPVVPIRTSGARQPLFFVHGGTGDVNWLDELARHIGHEWPVYGLEAPGLDGELIPLERVEDLAAHYVKGIHRIQPAGPYALGGYSGGGAIAFEMAQQLTTAGVNRIVLLDANAPGDPEIAAMQSAFGAGYVYLVAGSWLGSRWGQNHSLKLTDLEGLQKDAMLDRIVTHLYAHAVPPIPEVELRHRLQAMDRLGWTLGEALRTYHPRPLSGPVEVTLFECVQGMAGGANPLGLPDIPSTRDYRKGWSRLFAAPIKRIALDCDHFSLFKGQAARQIASMIAPLPPSSSRVDDIVIGLVRDILPEVPNEAITPDCSMDELGATSIDRIELATRAMEELRITVPHAALSGIASIGALIEVLRIHAGHG